MEVSIAKCAVLFGRYKCEWNRYDCGLNDVDCYVFGMVGHECLDYVELQSDCLYYVATFVSSVDLQTIETITIDQLNNQPFRIVTTITTTIVIGWNEKWRRRRMYDKKKKSDDLVEEMEIDDDIDNDVVVDVGIESDDGNGKSIVETNNK